MLTLEPELVDPKPAPDPGDHPRQKAVPRTLLVALALVTAAVLAGGGLVGFRHYQDQQREDRRQEATSAAEKQALALLTISTANVDDRLKTLLAGSTGDFQRQLDGIKATFATVVQKGEVNSQGTVVSAAVTQIDEGTAQVLLALDATVTNSETKNPEGRYYRLLVDLTRKEDRWLVSGMKFVP